MTSAPVMLVEDNQNDMALNHHVLRRCRVRNDIVAVVSAERAIEYLYPPSDEKKPPEKPGLIILDLDLPGISGFDLLRRLKECEATSDIVVIILSGTDGEDDRRKALELGARKFIQKSDEVSRLRADLQLVADEWLDVAPTA